MNGLIMMQHSVSIKYYMNRPLFPIDVSCRIDRYNRMSVEIETPTLDQKKIGRTKLAKKYPKFAAGDLNRQ